MSSTELKMQPTIHLYLQFHFCRAHYVTHNTFTWNYKCIVGSIFNPVRLIIIHEILCVYVLCRPKNFGRHSVN
jgi:hypothetical protein